jgi:hypothetical protein
MSQQPVYNPWTHTFSNGDDDVAGGLVEFEGGVHHRLRLAEANVNSLSIGAANLLGMINSSNILLIGAREDIVALQARVTALEP